VLAVQTRHIALPAEHGAWVFLLSPLLIGVFAATGWGAPSLYLAVAALAAFLARQPLTLAVKAWSGRKSRELVRPALAWFCSYAAIGSAMVAGLATRGFPYVLWLALPAAPVQVWHLWLVARRAERRQWLIEIAGAGALALSATAAYWVGSGGPNRLGWWLWVLTWAQSTTSILHAYMRLRQRTPGQPPSLRVRLRMGSVPVAASLLALLGSGALAAGGITPRWVFLAYLPQLLESAWGTLRPATGHKPRAIGYRQLAVSVLYTVLFIVSWRALPGSD